MLVQTMMQIRKRQRNTTWQNADQLAQSQTSTTIDYIFSSGDSFGLIWYRCKPWLLQVRTLDSCECASASTRHLL